MSKKFLKIGLFLSAFVFLNGFLPFSALLGPGFTIASSGNIFKAGAQLLIDHQVKKKTGKNSLEYVKEEVSKKSIKTDVDQELRNLVEARIKITHEKLIEQNQKKNLNKQLVQLVEKQVYKTRKKLNLKKINQ
tara:strand:+ start:1067 stop:1465 length:399 start_codon:yes stop_codon:yes gene_type:complete